MCLSQLPWLWCWCSGSSAWDITALQGCCGHHRKDGALATAPGAHRPCPAPQGYLLSTLHSHRCQVCSKTCPRGCSKDLAAPSGTAGGRAARWVLVLPAGAGRSVCLELLLSAQSPQPCVALIHIFIRINEACNKCIGKAQQAAERQRQWMTAGKEGDKAVYCTELGSSTKPQVHLLARAAREQRTWAVCTLPVYMLPSACTDTQKCSRFLTITSLCTQACRRRVLAEISQQCLKNAVKH